MMLLLAIVIGVLFAVGMAAVHLEDPCALSTVEPDTGCINCLSETEKKILLIYIKNIILASLTQQSVYDVGELRTLAKCYACQSDSVLLSEEVRIWANVASKVSREELPDTATEIAQAVKCFCGISQHELDTMLILLDCKLAQELVPVLL